MQRLKAPIEREILPILPRRMTERIRDIYRGATRRSRRPAIFAKNDLVQGMRNLGIADGDVLYVESCLGSIGRVSGGPNTVIDALIEAVGPKGTLVMPAFTTPFEGMATTLMKGEVFNRASTPCTLGPLPEAFRRRPGTLRSIHPTSSICASGAKADFITRPQLTDFQSNFGEGTALWRVMRCDAKTLGLGVDDTFVSFSHVLEDVLGDVFPVKVHLDSSSRAKIVDGQRTLTMVVRPLNPKVLRTGGNSTGSVWARSFFNDLLSDRGVLKVGRVGEARSWLVDTKGLVDVLEELSRQNLTIYTAEQEYGERGTRMISYVADYRSPFSGKKHNYLEDEVQQVARDIQQKGFWDSSSKNWIRELEWDGSNWSGYRPHDWKYAIEMQEGATQYALLTGSNALDNQLRTELEFIHSRINVDGSISSIPDRKSVPEEYEYGAVLSALALGCRRFANADKSFGKQILDDLDRVQRVTAQFKPTYDDAYTVILRGYANLLSVYQLLDLAERASAVRRKIDEHAQIFMGRQAGNGVFPLTSRTAGESGVHWQLKLDIALLLAYARTNDARYLGPAARNIEWISKNLLKRDGALKWYPANEEDFFEIHQMLYMIACRYLCELSSAHRSMYADCILAWRFLVETNPGYVDMYVGNALSTGAFFSFRHIDRQGRFQKGEHGKFKGSYEIGYSLWALALNRDLAI